jgi:hypothetical protein
MHRQDLAGAVDGHLVAKGQSVDDQRRAGRPVALPDNVAVRINAADFKGQVVQRVAIRLIKRSARFEFADGSVEYLTR